MPDRSIYCTSCNRYLGVIRDAKLHKDIKHLCGNCDIKRIASDMGNNIGDQGKDYGFNDIFKDILNKR